MIVVNERGKTMRKLLLLICLSIYGTVYAGINEWTYLGLYPQYVEALAKDPQNPDVFYAAALDIFMDTTREGGLFRTTDHGVTWDTLGFTHSYVNGVAVDPVRPNIVWIANGSNGVWRSTDFGISWENRSNGIYTSPIDHDGPVSIAVCPHNSEFLLCGGGSDVGIGSLYRSTNSGIQWTEVATVLEDYPKCISYDISAPGLVYAMTSNVDIVWMSADTGRTFSPMTPGEFLSHSDLRTALNRPGAVWFLSYENGLQLSEDSGHTWHSCMNNWRMGNDTIIWAMDIAGRGDTMVVETNFGPFLSFNGGDSLIAIERGLSRIVDHIWFVKSSPLEIWGCVRVHGMWSYTYDASNSIGDKPFAATPARIITYPNPFNTVTNISFTIPQTGQVSLHVYNLLGQEVTTLVRSNLQAGTHTIPFDGSALSSGVYIYSLEANGFTANRKMALVK